MKNKTKFVKLSQVDSLLLKESKIQNQTKFVKLSQELSAEGAPALAKKIDRLMIRLQNYASTSGNVKLQRILTSLQEGMTAKEGSKVVSSLERLIEIAKSLPGRIQGYVGQLVDLIKDTMQATGAAIRSIGRGAKPLPLPEATATTGRATEMATATADEAAEAIAKTTGRATEMATATADEAAEAIAKTTGKAADAATNATKGPFSRWLSKGTTTQISSTLRQELTEAFIEEVGGKTTKKLTAKGIQRAAGIVFRKALTYAGPAVAGFFTTYDWPVIVRMANEMLGKPWSEETETWIISVGLGAMPIAAGASLNPAGLAFGTGAAAGSAGAAIKEGLKTYSDPEGDVQKAKRALQSEEELNIKLKEAEPHLNKLRAKIQALESQITGPNDPKIDEWIKAVETMHQIDVKTGLPGNRPWYIRLHQAQQAGYKSPWHVPANNASLQGTRIVKTNLRLLANDPNEGWKEIGTMPKGTKVKLLSGKKRFTTRPGVYADYIKVQSEDGRVGWVDSYGLTYANGQNAPAVANAMSSKGLHVIASGPNSIDENGQLIRIAKNTPVRIIPGIRTYDQDNNEAYVYIEMPDGRKGWAPKRDLRLLNVTDRMMNCYK